MGSDDDTLTGQNLGGDGTSKDQGRRQATGKVTAATVVIEAAIADFSGIIGMAGAHDVAQLIVILGMLVAVADHGT